MASKFSQFLNEQKIDPRRLLVASAQVEKLRPVDRAAKLARRRNKASASAGTPKDAAEAKAIEKPRSGRPITRRLLKDVETGKALSGPAKTRLLRAVNRILEQKKKDPVDLRSLF